MKIKKNMRKYVIALAAALLPTMGMFAQVNGAGNTDKWIKNVDASVTLGTTGVGVDVAVPINEIFQVRTGFSFTPRIHATMNFAVQVGDEKESDQVQAEKFNRLADMLEEYTKQVAKYLDTLQDGYGIKAPVVLNLLPVDGKTWYCKLSKDDYISLYKKIQNLLDDEDVTKVVYSYSETYQPGKHLMDRYPDNKIDVINVTYLQSKNAIDLPLYQKSIKEIVKQALPFAQDHNNAFGLTTGVESIGDSSIFSETLLTVLKQHHTAYLMFGRNQGEPIEKHYYTPYPGVSNKKTHGFMEMINDEVCVFLEKLNGLYLEH